MTLVRRRWPALLALSLVAACSSAPTALPGATSGNGDGAPPTPDTGPEAEPPALRPVSLSADEVANRLSRFLWGQDADDDLRRTVDAAAPATGAMVEALARAMLADDRARAGVGAFYAWWLGTDDIVLGKKDPALFPEDSPALRQALADEPRAFGSYVTLDGDHSYRTLMTAPFSFINEPLARVYQVAGVMGATLQKTPLDPQQRAGLLTQPGWLALQSSDISPEASSRGYFILRKMMCVLAPAPPLGERNGDPPANTTNRAWIIAGTKGPNCQACHHIFDPIGFGLGNFDALGRFSTTEHGLPVDPSGTLLGNPFIDQMGLAVLLANTRQAQDCFAQQWLTYALGRNLGDADAPSLAAVQARFAATSQDIPPLIAAVAGSAAFLAP